MRAALLSALLLAFLALAGCSDEPPAADGDGSPDGGDDRVSDPGSQPANATDPPHDDVQLLSQPFEAVGQGSQTYDVTVPDEVTNVDFSLVSGAPATQRVSLTVSLSGCGAYSDPTISGQVGGANVAGGRLCADAAGGAQQVTIEVQGAIADATLTVTGQVPK